jgi:hypothetical protein
MSPVARRSRLPDTFLDRVGCRGVAHTDLRETARADRKRLPPDQAAAGAAGCYCQYCADSRSMSSAAPTRSSVKSTPARIESSTVETSRRET